MPLSTLATHKFPMMAGVAYPTMPNDSGPGHHGYVSFRYAE